MAVKGATHSERGISRWLCVTFLMLSVCLVFSNLAEAATEIVQTIGNNEINVDITGVSGSQED